MSSKRPPTREFAHGNYAYVHGWCRCAVCTEKHDEYNAYRRSYNKKKRQARNAIKNLATIPMNPLLEWIEKNNKWEDIDRHKRRRLLRYENKKMNIYEADKLCSILGVHPIEIYGWDWVANPDITEGAEVVE